MRKKVAFFLPHFGHGGAEGVVLSLLKGMDRTAHMPVLILQRRKGELLSQVPGDVDIFTLNHPRLPGCIRELSRLFTQEDIALIVTLTNASSLYAVPAARLAKPPIATLVTEHTPLSSFLKEAKMRRLRQVAVGMIYPYATLTGGPIEDIGTDLQEILGQATPPYVYLPNPVVQTIGALRVPSPKARSVVSIGRLASEKRFDLLIDAFAQLHRHMPDATLTIFGEGAERSSLESQIAKQDLKDSVRLPGYTSDLDSAHGVADIFVCTSRREGLGNAMIEAMARGVPVISVDCPFGPKRVLRDGKAGLLLKDHSPAAIAEAMRRLLEDHPLRTRLAIKGMEVARHYETGNAVKEYQTAFARAIAHTA